MSTPFRVELFIYDLSSGLAKTMSPMILGRQIDGIWHTSISVYNNEYFFGSGGVEDCQPKTTILGEPLQIIFQGSTEVPLEMFEDYLYELGSTTFAGSKYNILHHNCNTFSNEVSIFLTGKGIPKHILDLPNEVLNTPFGQTILPMLEQAQNQIHGAAGHTFNRTVGPSRNYSTPADHSGAKGTQNGSKGNRNNNALNIFVNLSDMDKTSFDNLMEEEEQFLTALPSNADIQLLAELDKDNNDFRRFLLIAEALFRQSLLNMSMSLFIANPIVASLELLDSELNITDSDYQLVLLILGKFCVNLTEDILDLINVRQHYIFFNTIQNLNMIYNHDNSLEKFTEISSALAINLAIVKKNDDSLGFELGCYLVNVIANKQCNEVSGIQFCRALYILCQQSTELIQFAALHNLDLTEYVEQSETVRKLQLSIQYAISGMQ